jgi:ABC-2 type transport system ATP-binding protein
MSATTTTATTATADYAIEMDGLTRRFGDFVAVENVTLKIRKGQLYGFLGLNGAGKTTTIRMLTTLLPPSSGAAKLWGHDVLKEPLAVRKLVGLVSDETSESQSAWTAREYLSYFARVRQMPDPGKEVERILDDVGLAANFRGKLIHTYSTGMKRRVEIARALMGRPKVLFLDEPTRGLDLPAKRDMWGLLRRLAATESVTTFLSSHDAQEIRSLCSEISVIAHGRLVHTGPTRDLGSDIDAFEERLVEMLTQSERTESAGLHFRPHGPTTQPDSRPISNLGPSTGN